MSVEIDSAPKFGTPQVLFDGRAAGIRLGRGYDVSPDGERFVAVQMAASEGEAQSEPEEPGIVVVENWFAEFKDKP